MDKDKLAIGDILIVEEGSSSWVGVVTGQETDGTPVIVRFTLDGMACIAEREVVFGDKPVMDSVVEAWRQSQMLKTRSIRTIAGIAMEIYKALGSGKPGAAKMLLRNLNMYRVDVDWEPS